MDSGNGVYEGNCWTLVTMRRYCKREGGPLTTWNLVKRVGEDMKS